MKLSISKEQIINGLQAVQNVVGSRTTLPILSNVLLNAQEGRLRFTATDLDVTISCSVESNIERPGAVTLPVKKVYGLVRELAPGEIEMEVDDRNTCTIRSAGSLYKLNGLAAEEFPPLAKFDDRKRIVLPQERVKTMLRRTSFAMSNDETRYVLNGIFFSLKDHKFTMVATDGRRLALAEEEADIPAESQGELIVPTKAINELNRLMQPTGQIELTFTENQVAMTLNDEKGFSVLVISKLVEGTYPNFRQVIPNASAERVALPREEFLQALRRAEIMTSEKSNSVKLSFAKNTLAITANTPEVGEARENLAVNYKGNGLAVAFNPVYLMDPLKALDNDEIFLEVTDELSPGVVKINGPFLYVIMPMRMT